MFSKTREMLAELEAAVDALQERQWRPSDAMLADTLFSLGDAVAELDRILADLYAELLRRQSTAQDDDQAPVRSARATSAAQ